MRRWLLWAAGALALWACGSENTTIDPAGSGASGATGGSAGSGATDCSPELCDGVDNDCDGDVDEDCPCVEGDTQACFSGDPNTEGIGTCTAGQQTCDRMGQWGPCEGEVIAREETCDAADDDCDGEVDEGFGTVTCGVGICQNTVDECVGGVFDPCLPGSPNPNGETCDGTDDDCDGQVDEGCACVNGSVQGCYTGSPQTLGVGVCKEGTQTCVNGQWGACMGDITPSAEQCNGLDDDCDGTVDDGNPESGGTCTTSLPGVCAAGILDCVNGALACQQLVQPSAEICDGLDNNCNGQTDENNPGGGMGCNTGELGICSVGTTSCQMGMLQCIPNNTSQPETCNNTDDDCDGAIDNGNPGGGAMCTTGLNGVCGNGTQTCIGGVLQCVQNQQPSAEICDLLDNDCDGSYDEPFYRDTSNGNQDFPNVWSSMIPLVGVYQTQNPTSGQVQGHILPENDLDWFSVEAHEQKSDIFGDTAIKGRATITSPNTSLWYEVCICWSTATTYCGKDSASTVPTCVVSAGSPQSVTVNMEMSLGSTDIGYLDILVRPDVPSLDYGCPDWTVAWEVWE